MLRILSSLKCDDRVFSSFTLIWDRLINKQDTFGVFIDFLKAFDFFIGMSNTYYINLFQMELTENSITPENPNYPIQQSYVQLNGILTDRFPVLSGLRHGDSSSPTIYILYQRSNCL